MRNPHPTGPLPKGFSFASAAAGFKPRGLDLGLLASEKMASAAAVFTTNRVKAAPVLLNMGHMRRNRGQVRAVIVNSGNANCCTGPQGLAASRQTAAHLARTLGCKPEQILVCSTGVIGLLLPVEKITTKIPSLYRERETGTEAFGGFARAIMTTDTHPKWAFASFRAGGGEVRIAGCAKGAGMIHPQMATMLSFVATDASMAPALLRRALREVVGRTFNRVTVDGDTSTNDTVILLANGASAAHPITAGGREFRQFIEALENVCGGLARAIVTDGEGADRVAEIAVEGAPSDEAADKVARTIAHSLLVKTALTGADPNWGRILAAAGRAGVPFNPERAEIWMAGMKVYGTRGGNSSRHSMPIAFSEREAHKRLLAKLVPIRVVLGAGKGSARLWTCDITKQYVHINASYRT